jgi:SAM-dependent methyltransferase
MPAADEQTAQVDLDALIARLRDEVRWRPDRETALSARIRARSAAEQFWAVTAETPVHGGTVARFLKRGARRFLRWYVEPLARQQRAFNEAALRLVDGLAAEVDALTAGRAERERLLAELEERVLRVERRGAGAAAPPVPSAAPAASRSSGNLPDYFGFESRMRGPAEIVRERQRPYLDDFRGAAPVLDVGSGRGEFLGLLRDAGIEARGVEADSDMVSFARGEGLVVEHADLIDALGRTEDGSLGGIFAGQVAEHLPPQALLRFLELAYAKLRRDGVLVIETINPLSPYSLRNYFADLTHAQPLVPSTLSLLLRDAGFRELELRYLNEPARPDGVDPHIAEILYAPLDYAIVARR